MSLSILQIGKPTEQNNRSVMPLSSTGSSVDVATVANAGKKGETKQLVCCCCSCCCCHIARRKIHGTRKLICLVAVVNRIVQYCCCRYCSCQVACRKKPGARTTACPGHRLYDTVVSGLPTGRCLCCCCCCYIAHRGKLGTRELICLVAVVSWVVQCYCSRC